MAEALMEKDIEIDDASDGMARFKKDGQQHGARLKESSIGEYFETDGHRVYIRPKGSKDNLLEEYQRKMERAEDQIKHYCNLADSLQKELNSFTKTDTKDGVSIRFQNFGKFTSWIKENSKDFGEKMSIGSAQPLYDRHTMHHLIRLTMEYFSSMCSSKYNSYYLTDDKARSPHYPYTVERTGTHTTFIF